ncbi:CYTH and CHAD domain-containing protein [Streptomyces sp. NPDC003042]
MAETKREIERKFEFTRTDAKPSARSKKAARSRAAASGKAAASRKAVRKRLPDLTGTAAIAAVRDKGATHLDAVYYDTPDQRLAADGLTLRRRTGGADAGWHLKLPVSPGVRDEIHAPLADTVPRALTALLRSRVRGAPLEPQVRLRSERHVSHLLDGDGTLLAELATDAVRAERGEAVTAWTEVEVELADGTDPALLDAVEKRFRKAGLRVSDAPSKVARALSETGLPPPARPQESPEGTAGAYVLSYLREQRDALIAKDPAVRRDLPDSVHQMRVATRRLRSALATYRRVLDRAATDPLRDELRWLATELGADRDREVLRERLRGRLGELPPSLLLGPVRDRLRIWNATRRTGTRRQVLAVLDKQRYLTLLDSLDALLAEPPLLKAAARPAERVLPKEVLDDWDRLARRVAAALALEPGPERDQALHAARRAAKRARYAAEAATAALGKPARRPAKAAKKVQRLLGDHRDGVLARLTLRDIAVQAAAAGESAFTWGILYGREEALADRHEREFPEVWAKASKPRLRAGLK